MILTLTIGYLPLADLSSNSSAVNVAFSSPKIPFTLRHLGQV